RLTAGQQRGRLITQQAIGVDRRLRLRIQQLLDRSLVPLGDPRFEFVAGGSEARPTHQVSHQTDVFLVCHFRGLLPLVISLSSIRNPNAAPRGYGGWAASRR